MNIKPSLRDYFYFTKTERLGIVVLSSVLVLLLLSPVIHRLVMSNNTEKATPPLSGIERFSSENKANAIDEPPVNLFFFDPNTVTESELILLGIPPKTAASIVKYRLKGGIFKKKEDLARIYTLKEADYLRLLPWIHFPPISKQLKGTLLPTNTTEEPKIASFNPNTATEEQLKQAGLPSKTRVAWINYLAKGGSFRKPEDIRKLYTLSDADYLKVAPFLIFPSAETPNRISTPVTPIEINNATFNQWISLPGIGSGWAGRILRFREKLGGFSTINQVAETNGLPDSVFQKIAPFLSINEVSPTTISINTATISQLTQHPYITAQQARWIITFRQQHGSFKSKEDLLQIPTLEKGWFEKIKPYLSL
jgi:competence ComEA-like helix-hairpin-helix protein